MILLLSLSIFIAVILLTMTIIMITVKKKAGKTLIKIKSFETYIFSILGIFLFFIGLYMVLPFEINTNSIFISIIMFLFSIYFLTYAIIIKNSITENGIIVLNNYQFLIKWSDINRFAFNGKKIYFDINGKFISINIINNNIDDFNRIFSQKISIEKRLHERYV